jgi:hypothetical protein
MTQQKPSQDTNAQGEQAATKGKTKRRHINITHRSNIEISANIGGQNESHHVSASQTAPIRQHGGRTKPEEEKE